MSSSSATDAGSCGTVPPLKKQKMGEDQEENEKENTVNEAVVKKETGCAAAPLSVASNPPLILKFLINSISCSGRYPSDFFVSLWVPAFRISSTLAILNRLVQSVFSSCLTGICGDTEISHLWTLRLPSALKPSSFLGPLDERKSGDDDIGPGIRWLGDEIAYWDDADFPITVFDANMRDLKDPPAPRIRRDGHR
jgi:hypothetical protein